MTDEARSQNRLDAFLAADMARLGIPGLSIAVARGGKLLLTKGYALAHVERSVPATADTAYRIASITKSSTATGVHDVGGGGQEWRLRLPRHAGASPLRCQRAVMLPRGHHGVFGAESFAGAISSTVAVISSA